MVVLAALVVPAALVVLVALVVQATLAVLVWLGGAGCANLAVIAGLVCCHSLACAGVCWRALACASV